MKPGGLCSPSNGSSMPSGDAVSALPTHKPPDSCRQFSKASPTSREDNAHLIPDMLVEHGQAGCPTTSRINGLVSHAGLSNGVYTSSYSSNKGLHLPCHVLSLPQTDNGEGQGPASCTALNIFSRSSCSAKTDTVASNTSSQPINPTCSLPNICGKSFKQLTIITSKQEEKSSASICYETSGDSSSFCSMGNPEVNPKAALGGYGLATVSAKCAPPTLPRCLKSPKGRRRISLEEMVKKLHNRTEAKKNGPNVLQSFSAFNTVKCDEVQEKSEDCLHKDMSCLLSKSDSGVQSGRSVQKICDNNNTAIIVNAHQSKDSSSTDINSKSDSRNPCCSGETSSTVCERTPEVSVNQSHEKQDNSQIAAADNVSLRLPITSNTNTNVCNSDSATELCAENISDLEATNVDVSSSLPGHLVENHEQTRVKDFGRDIIRTEGSVDKVDVSAGKCKDPQIKNVLKIQCNKEKCFSKDFKYKSDQHFGTNTEAVSCEVSYRNIKDSEERHSNSLLQVASNVASHESAVDLTLGAKHVEGNSAKILENVKSECSENGNDVFLGKGQSSDNSDGGSTEIDKRTSSTPLMTSKNVDLCSGKGTQTLCDSAREMDLSKTNDESNVPTSLVSTECESVQYKYLEPISDDENSLLCAPLSSGLSSVSGFQSNSNTPMFSDTPSDASRGTLMVRISDAVAAILSDVSDESLPVSPLASNSNSVDGFQSSLPGEKLTKKIGSICERLDKEYLKDTSTHSMPVENSTMLLSNVDSENSVDDNCDKKRTTLEVCISEKIKSIKNISSDIVQPELCYGEIQKRADLVTDTSTSLYSIESGKCVSRENVLQAKSTCKLPSIVTPNEPVTEEEGSENRPQQTYISALTCVKSDSSVKLADKMAMCDSHNKCVKSSCSVSGLLSDVTNTGQSSSYLIASSDKFVDLSSLSQVPLKDLGTNNCSNMSSTGGNLCQTFISGSQTISSQTQNCNTSRKEKDNAAGCLQEISNTALDNLTGSGKSPVPISDDFPRQKCTTHLENQSPWKSVLGEDNSSLESALKICCVPPISLKGSNQLSLVPVVELEKDSCLLGNRENVPLICDKEAKPCISMIESADNVDNLLLAKSGILKLSEVSNSPVRQSCTSVKSVSKEVPIICKSHAAEVPQDLSVKCISGDIHSTQEYALRIGSLIEKSSQEPISLLRNTIVHGSALQDCTVKKDYFLENQTDITPNLEASLQRTSLSSECDGSLLAPEKISINDDAKAGLINEDDYVIGSSHTGGGISSVQFTGVISKESGGDLSVLQLAKETPSLKEVLIKRKDCPEELYSSKECHSKDCHVGDADVLSEMLDKSKLPVVTTKERCPSVPLSSNKSTMSNEILVSEANYSAGSATKEVISKVPITDVKSSLFISNSTQNSVVSPHIFTTVVPIDKSESLDQDSYKSPSEVELNTNLPCSQISTTSDKATPHEESTSPSVHGSFRNASEYSRPKSKCYPPDGASGGLAHSECASSSFYTNLVIQSTLQENDCHTVGEINHGLPSIVKNAPEVVRPSLEDIEASCLPAEVRVSSQLVPAAKSSKDLTSLVGTMDECVLTCHNDTKVSHLQAAAVVENSHSVHNTMGIMHIPAAANNTRNPSTTDTEISQPANNVSLSSEVTDGACSLAHVFENKHPPILSADIGHSSIGIAEDSHTSFAATDLSYPSIRTTEVTHPPRKTTEGAQLLDKTKEVYTLPVDINELVHRSAESTEITFPLGESTGVTHPLTDAVEVAHLLVEASVTHSPAKPTEVPHLPVETTGIHPSFEATVVTHNESNAAISLSEGTKVNQLSDKSIKMDEPLTKVSKLNHLLTGVALISYPSYEATETGIPPSRISSAGTLKVSHPTIDDNIKINLLSEEFNIIHPPSPKATEVVCPSAEISYLEETNKQLTMFDNRLITHLGISDRPNMVCPEGDIRQAITLLEANDRSYAIRPKVNSKSGISHLEVDDKPDTAHPKPDRPDITPPGADVQPGITSSEVDGKLDMTHPDNVGPAPYFIADLRHQAKDKVKHLGAKVTTVFNPPASEITTAVKYKFSDPTAEAKCTTDGAKYTRVKAFTDVNNVTEAPTQIGHLKPIANTEIVFKPADANCAISKNMTEIKHAGSEVIIEGQPKASDATFGVNCPYIESSSQFVSSSELGHLLAEAINIVCHTTDEEVNHRMVGETTVRSGYPIIDEIAKIGRPSGFEIAAKASRKTIGKVASEICQSSYENIEVSNPTTIEVTPSYPIDDITSDVSHSIDTEATSKVNQPVFEEVTAKDNQATDNEVTADGNHPLSDEIFAESSPDLLEVSAEFSHPSAEDSTQACYPLFKASTETSYQPLETANQVIQSFPKPTLDYKLKVSSTSRVGTGSWTDPSLDGDKLQLVMFKRKTLIDSFQVGQSLRHPLCDEFYNIDKNECRGNGEYLTAGILGNSLQAVKSGLMGSTVIEDGASKCDEKDDKGVSLRVQPTSSEANNHTNQETSLKESFDIENDGDGNQLLKLASVKEEVQQLTDDSSSSVEVEVINDGVLPNVDEIGPVAADTSSSSSDTLMKCIPTIKDVYIREEQVLISTPTDTNSVGDVEILELEALETECPLCSIRLNVPLEDHLTKCHICNTFVPAKETTTYRYHMLKRVKDMMDIPDPVDAALENHVYVCRSCHFASQDINAVRFHLNTHEDVYQVRSGDATCKCNQKKYSYPFHKWKTLIHNSSYYCSKCNYYFACEKGFSSHLQAIHFMKNCCKFCKAVVPENDIISHAKYHQTEDKISLNKEAVNQQVVSIVTRSSGGNFGISWNIYDNYINFLDGKNFHLNTSCKVFDPNLDRSYLKLPLRNVMEEAVVPDEARIDPGKDIAKYLKGKKSIKISLGDDYEFIKNFSLSIQMEFQKKILKKGRKRHGSCPRIKRENDLFDILGISTMRSRGAQKKEVVTFSSTPILLKNPKAKLDLEDKKEAENPEVPLLTRTRSGMQSGRGDHDEKTEEKFEFAEPSVVVDGEWSKEHTYICCSCGAGFLNLADIMDHKWEMHPSVWCAHTMIQGQGVVPLSFCQQYQPPTNRPYRLPLPGIPMQQSAPSRRNSDADVPETERKDQKTCSSCNMHFQDINVFHAHLVDCGGLTLLSATKKKSKKGFRFKRRKGQGVPNNRYGNCSQPSTPLKAKFGDRSSGLNTPQNDRSSTAFIHSSGVKRRLELAVGSIDNLELKNRLKAIISGSRGSGSNTFRLPGKRTVRMKLRKKALETRKLRKTRHSDRVKENIRNEEKKDIKKIVGKSENENVVLDQGAQNEEELVDHKMSALKDVTCIESVKEFKQPINDDVEESKSKEKLKKKVSKVAGAKADGNTASEVNKPLTLLTLQVTSAVSSSKNKKRSKQVGDKEASKVVKKIQTEKKINGVIDKDKKAKKKVESLNIGTQTSQKHTELKLKQLPLKKLSNKANKIALDVNPAETCVKQSDLMKLVGLVEKKDCVLKKSKTLGKQTLGKKIIGSKLKSLLGKNGEVSDKPGGKIDKKPPKKVSSKKRKSLDSECVLDTETPATASCIVSSVTQTSVIPPSLPPSSAISSKVLVEEKKAKLNKIKEMGNLAEVVKKHSQTKKSADSNTSTMIEVIPSEGELVNCKETKTKVQEILKSEESEVKEAAEKQLPRGKKQVLYYSSSSEDESGDSYDSEPEVIRNFRSGRRCGGRMGLRNKRIPINTRYSFRTCSSVKTDEGDSSVEESDDNKQKKVDYLEKEEEEFSDELPVTSKRRRKVANYENQDDYAYVPYDSSSDLDWSEKEIDSNIEQVALSNRKKRKMARMKEISKPLRCVSPIDDSLAKESELEVPVNTKQAIQLQHATSSIVPSEVEMEVKLQKGKKNKIQVNTDTYDFSGNEDNIECKEKVNRKKRKLASALDDITSKEELTLKMLPNKNKHLLGRLICSNKLEEDVQDTAEKLQRKGNMEEIQPKVAVNSGQKDTEGTSIKLKSKHVKSKNVAKNVMEIEESTKKIEKKKCVKLPPESRVNLHTGGTLPIIGKTQKKNVKSRTTSIDAIVSSVQDTPIPVVQDDVQEVTPLVSKKKNSWLSSTLVSTASEESTLEGAKIVRKVQKKKKPKSELRAMEVFQPPEDRLLGQLPDEGIVRLPSTAKRKKKVKKISPNIFGCSNQNFSTDKEFSHILPEEEDDDLPLATLAQKSNKKKKSALNKKNNKSTQKEPRQKKPLLMAKAPFLVKKKDSLLKESIGHDSESSSFEGFIPVPSKKADKNKMGARKPRKRLELVKAILEANNSSTASDSELSDVAKPITKPKKILNCSNEANVKDLNMPNLTKVSKAESADREIQKSYQSSVRKAFPQKTLKTTSIVCGSSEINTKVIKSSKEKLGCCVSHTMPILEPMNIFKEDKGGPLDLSESDSNGEGDLTLTQKTPARVKRHRSSVEKIKDIPTRSSILVQVQDGQNPPELKEITNELMMEDGGSVSLLIEHQVPPLKEGSLKPPQPRKKRIGSSQEGLLQTKSESTLDSSLEIYPKEKVISSVRGGIIAVQKKPEKRKRAASTSGVPSKDKQELVNAFKKDIDQSLVNLASPPKKNCVNTKRKKTNNNNKQDANELSCIDCGLKFGSLASLEDHQQDCVTIAFEMSLMEAEDHLFECPHCHLTFALKGTQRKHTTSCRMVKYKRTTHRQDSKTLKRNKNSASLHTQLSEAVVTISDVTTVQTSSCKASVISQRCSKENVASDNDRASTSPHSDSCVASLVNQTEKIGTSLIESNLKEIVNKADNMQRVVPISARGSPRTKKESQVNGRLVNGEFLELSPVKIGNNEQCCVCGYEVTDQDTSNKHQLLQHFSNRCQQQAVLEVCAVVTYYNLGIDAVRALVSSAIIYQGSTILSLDAKQQSSLNSSPVSTNASSSCAIKLREILASPHCTRVLSTLETIAKHHLASDSVSISGTRQEALKAVSALEEILKEISEVESAIKKNRMLKSMRETFEAGTLT
ncbi:uncharacterized protein [Procambarus clarkii]|uniref:uncharacterized protein n=1 Tax=Procambarus clarkii TaxID=6728 RepID=UPI001E673F3B|nr:uncharacterized protein LOC123768487 [Procambarus clarkii]XP_045615037.1 uncharacterized protein LOC123768487 [Procambarus clarkii]XP_045615038.1 uncharacterized protein LOC123768487 [Procambarus clarkii]XP_045615039.1 uncharacterized protein LOC123768487 [Procambarus clarkii]XP_045615040.1 uncharacterized protein LOC123768487 [Procambarus clarkii]